MDNPMHNVYGPMDPLDPPTSDPFTSRKTPLRLKDTLQDVENNTTPRGTFHKSKNPNRYQGYLASISTIIQDEPSTFKESIKREAWKDVMSEEYESIMKNNV